MDRRHRRELAGAGPAEAADRVAEAERPGHDHGYRKPPVTEEPHLRTSPGAADKAVSGPPERGVPTWIGGPWMDLRPRRPGGATGGTRRLTPRRLPAED